MEEREIILLGTTNRPPLVLFQPFFFRGNVVYVVGLFYQLIKTCQYHRRRRFSAMFKQQKRRPAETGPRFYFVLNKEREKEKRYVESALADKFMIPLARAVLMNSL
jgi:hypothetical protein